VSSIAFSRAEACFAIVDLASDSVHLVRPVAMRFDDFEVQVGEVEREACGSLDDNVTSAIVGDLEASG
jgi:hypothetical protein